MTKQPNERRSAPTQQSSVLSSAALDEFLDNAGHELRTPITALKGQIQLMQRRWAQADVDQRVDDRDRETLGRMLFNVERLNYQLQVFLDSAHITKGNLDLLPSEHPWDLMGMIERVARNYRGGNPSLTLIVAGPVRGEEVVNNWDSLRVETILNVLLANAVRYGAGRPVTITVSRDADEVRVEVRDDGVGVPPDEREHIFEPYIRGSNATGKGVGLGLAVARALARLHGGDLDVTPHAGAGSIFCLRLPLTHYRTLRDQALPPE